MKHAGSGALEHLADLLASLRTRSRLREKRPGIFYLGGRAFLHFHEDPSGLFADVRHGGDWLRLPVNKPEERSRLLAGVDRILARPQRLGFMSGQIEVPEDFDRMGATEIEKLFGTSS